MSNIISNGEKDEVNAKKIANKSVSGIKWRLVPVGVNEVVFIPGKSSHLSRLGAFFLGTQQW